MAHPQLCSIQDCGKAVRARGWCRNHWYRWRTFGDPLGGATAHGAPLQYLKDVVLKHEGDNCLRWPFATMNEGYGVVKIGKKLELVHRLVCTEVHGPAPTPKHHAAHSCGKGHEGCCCKQHLSWETPSQNEHDKLMHGTDHRGEKHPLSKLTEADVREIRILYGHEHLAALAQRFGVGKATIYCAAVGINWAWLDR